MKTSVNKNRIQGTGGDITVYCTRDGRAAVDVRLIDYDIQPVQEMHSLGINSPIIRQLTWNPR